MRVRPVRLVGPLILALLGLFLVVLMGVVLYKTYPALLDPGGTSGSPRFSGSPAQAGLVLGLFVSLILFGVILLVEGLIMTRTRERNLAMGWLGLRLIASIFLAGVLLVLLPL